MVDPIAAPRTSSSDPMTTLATATVCPYLLADDGTWRATTPTRSHRCMAVLPAAILSTDKQRRLCLTSEHAGCATFVAARTVRAEARAAGRAGRDQAGFARATARPLSRTAPLVRDHGRIALAAPTVGLRLDRTVGQAALVVLMVAAFAAIVLARFSAGGDPLATDRVRPSGSLNVTATAGATAGPSATAGTTPAITLVPSEVQPTTAPGGPASGAPASASPTTYTVRSGDTLIGIAARFDTTWQVLAEINGIEDPGSLRAGQVLDLP